MKKQLMKRAFICFFGFTLLFAMRAFAGTTYTWNIGASGSWVNPLNWSPSTGYPGSTGTTDIAIVNTSGVTITLPVSLTIANLKSTSYGVTGITINFIVSAPTLTIQSGLNMAQPASFSTVLTFTGTGSASIGGTSTFAYAGSMNIGVASTVSFIAGSTLDFSNNQGSLTNNGTLNFTNSTFTMGFSTSLVSPGAVIASNTNFNMNNSSAFITYAAKFVSNSCTFTLPSGCYIKSTNAASAFTATTSTFNLTGSGGAAYFYNNGTFRDHGSTYSLTGQSAYIQNDISASMHLSGTTVNFQAGSSSQYITNAGTFTADSASAINATTFGSYVTNSGTFYAGTSASACTITLSGSFNNVTNTGTFYLGSTSIIYPSSFAANITNTNPGVFTLQSDANGSAAIGALNGFATCTGTFNVERYFQGGATKIGGRWIERNYRVISSPVHNTIMVNSNNVSGLNYIVGGTAGQTTTASSATNAFITGCTGGSTIAGNPSTYLYRESITPSNASFTSGNFLGITNITNSSGAGTITASDGTAYSIPAGNGVLFFFRGAATNWTTRTHFPYIAPENVTLTSTGLINQQSVTAKDWYSPLSSNLGYTGAGPGGNAAVRGFNMVGNPYPCTIDWCTSFSGTGITRTNINPTIYEFNPVTSQFDTFLATSGAGGISTGNGSRYIVSGQGFFVQANKANPALVFLETAKAATSQLTGNNLLMGTPTPQVADNRLLRLRLSIDSANYDEMVLNFNSLASAKYNFNEDAACIQGVNAPEGISSFSDDSVKLSINSLPLPELTPKVVRLDIKAHIEGTYSLQRMALGAIPKLYDIWLMDNSKKDSLDIRNNDIYKFDVSFADTTSYGANRFSLVIRQNPALMVHLLNFTGVKSTLGSQIAWVTENEENYTNFTVERSADAGVTFNALGGQPSGAQGTYTFLDRNPPAAADMYRLKIQDLNGAISYSNVVTLMYGNAANSVASNISVYPNPSNGVIHLAINTNNAANLTNGLSAHQPAGLTPLLGGIATNVSSSYGIKIISITGAVIKNTTSSSANWQTNIASLTPGTYIIQVVNDNDSSLIGKSTFIKL